MILTRPYPGAATYLSTDRSWYQNVLYFCTCGHAPSDRRACRFAHTVGMGNCSFEGHRDKYGSSTLPTLLTSQQCKRDPRRGVDSLTWTLHSVWSSIKSCESAITETRRWVDLSPIYRLRGNARLPKWSEGRRDTEPSSIDIEKLPEFCPKACHGYTNHQTLRWDVCTVAWPSRRFQGCRSFPRRGLYVSRSPFSPVLRVRLFKAR